MKFRTKILATTLVVGVLGGLVALGVSGAFSATTQNAGNEIRTGTVTLSDNDAGQALFNIDNAKPGDSWTRCIKVTYNGTLPSEVRAYLQSSASALTPYIDLHIHSGIQAGAASFPDCTGYEEKALIYDGPLTSLTAFDYASGFDVDPENQTTWQQGDTVVFEIEMELSDSMPNTVQNQTSSNATIVWEGRDS